MVSGGTDIAMELLRELIRALEALPKLLPSDLLSVHLDLSGRGGCVSCRNRAHDRPSVVGPLGCDCEEALVQLGVKNLARQPLLMSMTLRVHVRGVDEMGAVFIGVGVDPESLTDRSGPKPYLLLTGLKDHGRWEYFEDLPAADVRRGLVAMIFDEAIACGCSVIAGNYEGVYMRMDSEEMLTDCTVEMRFDRDGR